MKRLTLAILCLLLTIISFAQVKPNPKKPTPSKTPSSTEMDRMMQEAMKGMSKEEQEEMKKMMKTVQPAMDNMMKSTADYPEFKDNLEMVPSRDQARISAIGKKSFTPTELQQNTQALFNKLTVNAPAEEKIIINQVLAKHKKADELMAAASTAFLMGHRPAAAGLAMKAVLLDSKNIVYQNNLAAILTQSGYPEKAIPYLNTLRQQKPGNSTLNNNLGYAWFYLGELDSASRYIQFALRRNPAHAEAQLCAGVIAEAQGDEPSAVHAYDESFAEMPSHLPVKMLNNRSKKNPTETVDYQKLINNLTIFEYFDSNWAKLPTPKDDVNAWEENEAVLSGLKAMHYKLENEIKRLKEKAEKDLNALADQDKSKDGDLFATEMMKENLAGLNMMSKPAMFIIAILSEEHKRLIQEIHEDGMKLQKFKEEQNKIRRDIGPNAKCQDYEAKETAYMEAVNPRVEKFWEEKLAKYRVLLNAWCTWRWFITGNVKNVVTVELLTWNLAMLDIRKGALRDYAIEQPHCRANKDPQPRQTKDLVYYNTNCPPVVKIPFSLGTLEASANAAKMNSNAFGIKYAGDAIPNASLSFGVSTSVITEPGLFGNATLKTSEGGMTPMGMNYANEETGDELVPLPKLPPASDNDLTPLDRGLLITGEELTPLDKRLLNSGEELTPLDKRLLSSDDELTPLDKSLLNQSDELFPLDKGLLVSKAERQAILDAMATKVLLNRQIFSECVPKKPLKKTQPNQRERDKFLVYDNETGKWKKVKNLPPDELVPLDKRLLNGEEKLVPLDKRLLNADDELVPLDKRLLDSEELTPLDKRLLNGEEELTPLPKLPSSGGKGESSPVQVVINNSLELIKSTAKEVVNLFR